MNYRSQNQSNNFEAVGIYLDTFFGTTDRITPLLHIDLRNESERSFWVRTRSKNIDPKATDRGDQVYIYPMRDVDSMNRANEAIENYLRFTYGKK